MADGLGKNKGFVNLNILQAFGAANDNLFKQLIMLGVASGGIWSAHLGTGGQATIFVVVLVAIHTIRRVRWTVL